MSTHRLWIKTQLNTAMHPKVVKYISPALLSQFYFVCFSFFDRHQLVCPKVVEKERNPLPKCFYSQCSLVVVRKKNNKFILYFSSGSLLWPYYCFGFCQAGVVLIVPSNPNHSVIVHQVEWGSWTSYLFIGVIVVTPYCYCGLASHGQPIWGTKFHLCPPLLWR